VARTQSEPPLTLTPIAFQILLALAKKPQHGYGIKLDIEERTEGQLSLGSGTLCVRPQPGCPPRPVL
jgi:hypothetical protein